MEAPCKRVEDLTSGITMAQALQKMYVFILRVGLLQKCIICVSYIFRRQKKIAHISIVGGILSEKFTPESYDTFCCPYSLSCLNSAAMQCTSMMLGLVESSQRLETTGG